MKKSLPFLTCLFAVIFWYYAYQCAVTYSFCALEKYIWNLDTVIKALGTYAVFSMVPSLAVIFVRDVVFRVWLRFSVFWWLVSIVIIAITPTTSNSWMPIYSITKETVTWFMGGLFALISLVLIISRSFKK